LKYQKRHLIAFYLNLPSLKNVINNEKINAPAKKLASAKNLTGRIVNEPIIIFLLFHVSKSLRTNPYHCEF
jgi:hypothetical protein